MIMIIKFLMIIMIIIIMDITFITNWPESNAETHCHSVVLILSVHMVINIIFLYYPFWVQLNILFLQATFNVIN